MVVIALAAWVLLQDDAWMAHKAEESPGRNAEPGKNRPGLKKFLLPQESPQIHPSAYVAEGAVVLGAVSVGEQASIWFGSVLRGDINRIAIGPRSNIQDGTIVHVSDDFAAVVGADVTVGHRAIIHACEVGDGTLIGMGAIIMDGARVGAGSVVAAGSLVTKGTQIPAGSLVVGSPAKVVRLLSPEERASNLALAAKYVEVASRYRDL
jgi:carbonic anhydrase/acetyltransferase-like protein (isoleucine patch superfamily)